MKSPQSSSIRNGLISFGRSAMARGARLSRPLLIAFAFGSLHVSCAEQDEPLASKPSSAARLRARVLIADARAPRLSVWDVGDRETVGTFDLDTPAEELVVSHSGDTAAVVTGAGTTARLMGGGVAVIPHKDHIHIFKSPPVLLGEPLTGSGRVRASFGDAKWAFLFAAQDGDSPAAVVRPERSWVQNRGESVALDIVAHRGDVLPFGGSYLATRPTGDGVDAIGEDGAAAPLFECDGLDGATTTGKIAAFACDSGFIVIGADRRPSAPVPHPIGTRVRALSSLHNQKWAFGRDATGKTVIVDLEARTATSIEHGADVCEAVLEVGERGRLLALRASGALEQIDLTTGRVVGSLSVVAPFECTAPERPHVVGTPGSAWVSSPQTAEVLQIDSNAGSIASRVSFGGTPSKLALFGLDARNAELSLGNDDLSD